MQLNGESYFQHSQVIRMKRVKPLRNVAAAQSVLVVERELFGPFFLTTKKQSPSFLNLHPESIVFTTNKYSTAD